MLNSLLVRSIRGCRGLQSTAIRCTSSQGSATARLEHVEIHGKEFLRDDKWNLSPYVLKLLERQLLFEPSNPLALLKQRLINFFHKEYRKPGNRTPLFTVCDREPRVVTVFDNFDSLLVPSDHVSRKASDTYYVNANHCLRAHTSAHQFNLIKQGLNNFLVIGDVYRRDEINKTHYPCFHQVEGVRLYSRDELFGAQQRSDLKLFDNGERTKEKQETHMEDTAKALEISLKATLEQLCDAFFGKNCEKRWVDAYFPFTHPSFELEVFYEGKWLEVLGCGVMEQKLLQNAGVDDKVGWAFGIGLERIAMVLYGIPDIRLFWSRDSGFTSQFAGKTSEDNFKYKAISMYPQVLFDLSFFLPDGCHFNDMTANVYDLIRTIGGDLIEQVELTDEFFNKKSSKKSQTYRIVYRSNERVLNKEEVNLIHREIEKQLVQQQNVKIR